MSGSFVRATTSSSSSSSIAWNARISKNSTNSNNKKVSTPSTVRRTKNEYTFRVTAIGGGRGDEKPDPNEWMQNARKDTERRAMQFRKAREVSSGAKENANREGILEPVAIWTRLERRYPEVGSSMKRRAST